MNNNQMPYGYNPNFPPPIAPPWQNGNNNSCQCTNEIRNLEGKIAKLDRQVRRVEDRLVRLEGSLIEPRNNFPSYSEGYNIV